jgi:flagellar FliL protein
LVVVYFVTANILVSQKSPQTNSENKPEVVEEAKTAAEPEEESTSEVSKSEEDSKFIYSVEDIIVNPAGTNGNRLMLVSLGFGLSSEKAKKSFEEKEVIIKDMIISTISLKTLAELSKVGAKEGLKEELKYKLNEKYPNIKVESVYFSKYIIQ